MIGQKGPRPVSGLVSYTVHARKDQLLANYSTNRKRNLAFLNMGREKNKYKHDRKFSSELANVADAMLASHENDYAVKTRMILVYIPCWYCEQTNKTYLRRENKMLRLKSRQEKSGVSAKQCQVAQMASDGRIVHSIRCTWHYLEDYIVHLGSECDSFWV